VTRGSLPCMQAEGDPKRRTNAPRKIQQSHDQEQRQPDAGGADCNADREGADHPTPVVHHVVGSNGAEGEYQTDKEPDAEDDNRRCLNETSEGEPRADVPPVHVLAVEHVPATDPMTPPAKCDPSDPSTCTRVRDRDLAGRTRSSLTYSLRVCGHHRRYLWPRKPGCITRGCGETRGCTEREGECGQWRSLMAVRPQLEALQDHADLFRGP
jgi:hypothetical protein